MTDVSDTPLTPRYFDTTLWRMLARLQPLIDLARHRPEPDHVDMLSAIGAPAWPLGDSEKLWASWTVIGEVISRQKADDLSEAELLWVAITTLRQLLLGREPDQGAASQGDTYDGQVLFSVMAVGLLAARVFGDDAEEIMQLAAQLRGAERGRQRLKDRADEWRGPLGDFTDEWLARTKPARREHGVAVRILKAFRIARPEITLPGSDGPHKLVSKRVRQFLSG